MTICGLGLLRCFIVLLFINRLCFGVCVDCYLCLNRLLAVCLFACVSLFVWFTCVFVCIVLLGNGLVFTVVLSVLLDWWLFRLVVLMFLILLL